MTLPALACTCVLPGLLNAVLLARSIAEDTLPTKLLKTCLIGRQISILILNHHKQDPRTAVRRPAAFTPGSVRMNACMQDVNDTKCNYGTWQRCRPASHHLMPAGHAGRTKSLIDLSQSVAFKDYSVRVAGRQAKPLGLTAHHALMLFLIQQRQVVNHVSMPLLLTQDHCQHLCFMKWLHLAAPTLQTHHCRN